MWLNYDDRYAVSEDGEVMNRKTGLILSPGSDRKGRLHICIYNKSVHIHRMVALRFCPKIDLPGLEVDHINRDCSDNRASNLRWVSHSQNNRNKEASNISKNGNNYRVRFYKDKQKIYCETFSSMELAVAARDAFKLTDAYKL